MAAIKMEWLLPCDGVVGGLEENSIGALLQDYVDVVTRFAVCMRRHNDLAEYLAPVVAKERGK